MASDRSLEPGPVVWVPNRIGDHVPMVDWSVSNVSNLTLQQKIDQSEMTLQNQQWHATWSATEMQRQQAVARVAELEEKNADLCRFWEYEKDLVGRLMAENAALKQASATFGDPTLADLPAPGRRPDGTLAPQPRPFPVLKQASESRRVGG